MTSCLHVTVKAHLKACFLSSTSSPTTQTINLSLMHPAVGGYSRRLSAAGRPRVSNGNPYSELPFRTLKYCPQWPQEGVAQLGHHARVHSGPPEALWACG
ncbi:hypothetical protein CQ006_23500 [Pseudomonas cedrina]|uniref:Uncharacterized protein n=1 Tax=Pseudomonas cedrina TaxID=651740 RepID=A0A2S9DA29_PSECE|nr:hypothetical protein CLM72_13700 [Pseudomonas sp. MYb193]PRB94092.1 hypothetical protein CQ006_23500 [Pseudomonas cedrina]